MRFKSIHFPCVALLYDYFKEHLRDLGVPVYQNLPVGLNLQVFKSQKAEVFQFIRNHNVIKTMNDIVFFCQLRYQICCSSKVYPSKLLITKFWFFFVKSTF